MSNKKIFRPRYQDLKILEFIHMFRFMPLQVLSKILINEGLYTTYQAVTRNVKRLEQHNMIRPIRYGQSAKVLFLSKAGANTLSIGFEIPRENVNCPERLTGVNFFALEHTIKVAELYLLFSDECKKHDIELSNFQGDYSTRFEYQFRAIRGKKIKRSVMPDAMFKFTKNGQSKWFFVEYDRGTEYSKDVANKYKKYFEYFKYNENWRQKFTTFPIILFISESSTQRILNLVQKEDRLNFQSYSVRQYPEKIKNVVLRGIVMHENVSSVASSTIEEFLKPQKFLFIDYPDLQKRGLSADFMDYNQKSRKLI